MKISFYILAMTLFLGLMWLGCSEDSGPVSPGASQEVQILAKKANVPDIEAKPVFRIPTGRKNERLTVFIFYEKGGKGGGKKPPKDDGEGQVCSDPNTNQTFSEIGPRWSAPGIQVEYQSLFEPDAVVGLSFGAINRAFNAWETSVGNEALVTFVENPDAPLPPARDDRNVIGWRRFVGGRDAKRILAAAYITDDGYGEILEVDIVYNVGQKWAVNEPITPSSTLCGEQFDVQAIGTHEIGHLLGLGHVDTDETVSGDEIDATMAPTAAKGELKKQTLTPGDEDGANVVTPVSPVS